MPEAQFFASQEDEVALSLWIMQEFGCTFHLDKTIQRAPIGITGPKGLLRAIQEQEWGPRFFLTSKQWSEYPLQSSMTRSEFDGISRCYVTARHGGPAFDLIFGNLLGEEKIIAPSSISYYPFYHRPDRSGIIKPSMDMVNAFKAIKKYLSRNGTKAGDATRNHNPNSFILHHAGKLLQRGWKIP